MENFRDIAQLKEGQAGLQEQFHSLEDRQLILHEENVRRLDTLEKVLTHGNGEPPLVITVARIKAGIDTMRWLLAVVIVPVLIAAITTVWDHFHK